ncbi:MAG: DoxX family protein [Bacteroidia bacterium]|nr:DoxX family protein [Bacteroidia bacterium]
MKYSRIFLGLRIIVAVILIQTLRFKFTAHPDSVYIFESIGLEPAGRIGTGILELIAGILLLIPRTVWVGATLTLGVIGGAIVLHLTKLGIAVNQDGGILFITAIITFVLSAIILLNYWKQIPVFKAKS